jgi:hypothetical protein
MRPSFIDSPVFESEFPPRGLRAGALVRVRLARDGGVVEGVLQAVDRRGLRLEEREMLLTPTFRGADASGLFIEEEEAPSKRVQGLAWNQIESVQVRVRGTTAGLLWGIVLALALGWCGDGLDHLTDGSPKADLVNVGIGIGVLIGVLIARIGREWRTVWTAKDAETTPAR